MTKLVFHLGAPSPSFEQLTFSLRKSAFLLGKHKAIVRRPGQYRALLDNALMAHNLGQFTDEDRATLLRKLTMDQPDRRVLVSNGSLLEEPTKIFRDGAFYTRAGQVTRALRAMLPEVEMEFMLTVQNPITLVADLLNGRRLTSRQSFMNGMPFEEVRWSDVILEISKANSHKDVTIWAYEEGPTIWPMILRHVAGLRGSYNLDGDLDLIAPLIGELPTKRLKEFLGKQTDLTPAARLEIMEGFLQHFCDPEVAEQVIDLDGVNRRTVEAVSRAYETDLERCKTIEGVNIISAY